MAKDKSQLLRLVFIDKEIREGMRQGRLANCRRMAGKYEVSAKSIMRDIDYLKHQRDAPIAYDPQRHGYYYTEENYSLPALSLTESDLFAICVAGKALKEYEDTPVYRKLQSVFGKIEQSLPDKVSVQPAWVDSRYSVIQERRTRIDPAIWEVIAEALHRSRTVRISYRKPSADAPWAREVDPYHVVRYQGEWYLIAHCHARGKILTFAISRISRADLLTEEFAVPQDFDFEQRIKHRFGIFGGGKEYAVKIKFARKHAPYVAERQWHPTQAMETLQDGGVVLSFTANHLYEVTRWILSWGSGVRVLAPKELEDAVRRELRQALLAYETAAPGKSDGSMHDRDGS